MNTKKDLIQATEEFFVRHWNASQCKGLAPPKWSEPWELVGPTPYGFKQGTYAFLSRGEVIYIGVGASRGRGIYGGCGLGKRVQGYTPAQEGWRQVPEEKRLYHMSPEWSEVDRIMTIGFDREHAYLSYALEIYLIRTLVPKRNRNRPG